MEYCFPLMKPFNTPEPGCNSQYKDGEKESRKVFGYTYINKAKHFERIRERRFFNMYKANRNWFRVPTKRVLIGAAQTTDSWGSWLLTCVWLSELIITDCVHWDCHEIPRPGAGLVTMVTTYIVWSSRWSSYKYCNDCIVCVKLSRCHCHSQLCENSWP